MDYYATLGLPRGASDAEIKKAYRSMAMKHHPDRGGDEKKFKEVSQAYEFLSDPQKKQIIDLGGDPNQQNSGFRHQGAGNPFEFHFGTENINDIFGGFGFGFNQRQPQKNKSLNINVEVTLEEVLTGKEINAEIGMPGGSKKIINISIPPGIENGQQIRYEGMGDHSVKNLRPGDLIVSIYVRPHPRFHRDGHSLICEQNVSVWDAILGTTISIITIDNKHLDITIPPGTQPDTVMSCNGYGLPNIRSRQRGNILVRIKINMPKNLSPEILATIKQIKDGI